MPPPKKKDKLKYTDEDMKKALVAIREHKKGLRETSKAFGIPCTTLHDRLTGKRPESVQPKGPDPVLGVDGEKSVKDWLINIAQCGFPIKKEELLDTVQKIVKDNATQNPFKDDRPGQTWYRNFLKRHPDLSVRTAEGINKARARISEESIRSWFAELESFLKESNNQDIIECPERIFNGDESGFSMCPKSGKVLAPKGYRNLYQIKSGNEKENLTVLVTFNAEGEICPPLVVFPYVRPPRAVVDSMPEDWCLGKSESGWMRADVFFEYISNDFNNWVERNQIKKPVLLLVDGHRSHMSLVLSAMCESQQIILYALPPNTTHMLQPADVSVFGPLKSSWKTIVRKFLSKPENVNSCVTKTNFCKLFKETLDDTNMKQNIKNGFRKCGLYPFNPDAVDYSKCVQNTLENVRRKPAEDTNEICNEDLVITKKVLKHLKPVLKKKKIDVGTILKEIRKLKKPETSSISTDIDSEQDITGSINLSTTLQMECSAEGVCITEPASHSTDAAVVLPTLSGQANTVMDTVDFQSVLDETKAEKSPQSISDENASVTIITQADVHLALPSRRLGPQMMDFDEILPYSEETEEKQKVCTQASLPCNASFDEILPYPAEIQEDQKMTVTITSPTADEFDYEQPIVIDESLSTFHLTGTGLSSCLNAGSLVSLDDVVVIPLQVSTPVSENNAFSKHLFIPEAPKRAQQKQVRTPSAISSKAWRKFYEDKENVKLQKQEATRKRQIERSEKQRQKKIKREQSAKPKGRKGKKKTKEVLKELCAQCEEILISDVEDDDDKNLGCDNCPRWFHLKCTAFAGSTYTDVLDKEFKCHACCADED